LADWDVIIVGGGAAGLLAAGSAAQLGARILLLEKMDHPGRKLRISGKGRCNLTNLAPMDEFLKHFHPNGRFLKHAFHRFFNHDLIEFFHQLGVDTVVERGGRVFPVSNDANEVVLALQRWVKDSGVTVYTGCRAERLTVDQEAVTGVEAVTTRKSGDEVDRHHFPASAVILATGGASYPGTGSTGDGYAIAEAVGHLIVPIRPALVPLDTLGNVAQRLQGLTLRNVRVSVWVEGEKQAEAFGEMLFTHFGISGPIILTLSRGVVDAIRLRKNVEISIDLKPALDDGKLRARLLRDIDAHGRQQFSTILKGLLPRSLIPICVEQTNIPTEKPAHQITTEERKRLRLWLKDFRLLISGHRPLSMAIVTAGGVDLNEIESTSLASKLVDRLYFAGELVDLDADTGGYNLQAAFSTGRLAGRSAARQALSQDT
jgi:predicted Rossmann fold flavoprotein